MSGKVGRPRQFKGSKLIRPDGLHQDQYEWIIREAKHQGKTKSALLREAVMDLMKKYGVKAPEPSA